MSDLDLLSCREIRNFPGGKVRLAVNHDDFYLYVDDSDHIRTFDSSSLSSRTLPPADKSIRGQAVAFDFSPSHQRAVIAYSDGGLALFNLEDLKSLRVLTKPHATCASAVAFRDESSFLVSEGAILSLWRISHSLGIRLTVQDSELFQFTAPISGLFLPRIFSYVSSSGKPSSHCLAPRFSECLGIGTGSGFSFGWAGMTGGAFSPSLEIGGVLPACGFDRVDPSLLRFAVCAGTELSAYSVTEARSVSVLWKTSVPRPCTHLIFMSGSVVLGLGSDLRGWVVAAEGSAVVPDVVCPGEGVFIAGQHSFRLGSHVLLDVGLQTFGDRMDALRESADGAGFESAVELCRRVIANDARATIGLPTKASQRALVIERELTGLLQGEAERRLLGAQDEPGAEAVAEWLIRLNHELGMEDWLVGEGVRVFDGCGRLPVLLRKLVAFDHDGNAFCYTAQFGELLLEHADCDISSFLMRLPRDIVPLESLLTFGLARNDERLLCELLLGRGDLAGALTILSNAGQTQQVCLILLSRASGDDDEMDAAVRWLFANAGGRFPRATQILEGSPAQSAAFFEAVEQFVDRARRPFAYERFVEAMAVVLCGRGPEDELARWLDGIVLRRRVRVRGGCVGRLVRRVFVPPSDGPDQREEMLLHLLTCDVPPEFGESILGLCESFAFRRAKRQIQLDSAKYEIVIRELAEDPQSNIFEFAVELLSRPGSAAAIVRSAVLRNATVLCARDCAGFATFAQQFLRDCLAETVAAVTDASLRHCLIHELARAGVCPRLDRATDASFFEFLCKFFPAEARAYAEAREGDLRDFLPAAEKFGVFDCCAVAHARVDDVRRVADAFAAFVEEQLVAFAEEGGEGWRAVERFGIDFARTFLRTHGGSDAALFAEAAVRAFAIPLFALAELRGDEERCLPIVLLFGQIASLALNAIPFADFLRLFVLEFQELPFRFARGCLLSVVNDYEYDLDQKLSMVLLYHADEQNSHARYIREIQSGIEGADLHCCSCGRALFGVSCWIQVFGCGHVFHQAGDCLPKAVCPVCNPQERLGQDIQGPIHSIPRSRFRRELIRFENLIERKGDASAPILESLDEIELPQRDIFPP